MRVAVIGGGVAGVTAADTVKALKEEAEVIVITRERFTLYSRPAIYEIVKGAKSPEDLVIRGSKWFRDRGIELVEGVSADEVDYERRLIKLSDGEIIGYDRLVLATGSQPFFPPIEGLGLGGIHSFYTIEDALALARALRKGLNVVIVGAGPVGVKLAETIVSRYSSGIKVTIVEVLDRPLPRFLDREAGEIVKRLLEEHGIKLELGRSIRRFIGDGVVEKAILDDGRTIDCDLAVIAAGVRPSTRLAEAMGLEVKRGIVVNKYMETSVRGIYAAGDVAEVRGYEPGLNPVWPVAYMQGVVAGANIAGRKLSYMGLPAMNAQELFGVPIMSFGLLDPPKDATIRVYRRGGEYARIIVSGNRILGAVLVGMEEEAGPLFNVIASGAEVHGLDFIAEAIVPGLPQILGPRLQLDIWV